MVQARQRNQTVDVLRGIAILLVVLWHTMTGVTINSENSFLSNIVWSLQMPLFMLISGYVMRYSKVVNSGKEFRRQFIKKSRAYLLPWAVWTFGIRGFLFGEHDFFNISNLLWHMDNGYWFLISLWTITCLFTLAQWLSVFLCNNDLSGKRIVITTAFYLIFMGALAGIGLLMGLSFFCIKLTLYYMPFFYAGYLFGQYQDRLLGMRHAKKWLDAVVSICVFVWLFLLKRYNLFNMSESVGGIFIRITASITGCIAICGFTSIRNKNGNISQKFGGGGTLDGRTFAPDLSAPLSATEHVKTRDTAICDHSTGSFISGNQLDNNHIERILDYSGDSYGWSASASAVCKGSLGSSVLTWVGQHTLEIYLMHNLLLGLFPWKSRLDFYLLTGSLLVLGNWMATLAIVILIIRFLEKSHVMTKILWNK